MEEGIIGESVKSAISIKLGEIFGDNTIRYKEKVTKMLYPNFFIYIVSAPITPNTKNRAYINYLVNIKYRVAEDTTNLTNLELELDKIAFRLMTEFTHITLDKPIMIRNARYEKSDGVLEFMCNINVFIQKKLEEKPKQEKLKLDEEVEE